MLIKHADDKTKRLALLEELQRSSLLDKRQRDWLKDEQHRTVQGVQGEREAAHYIDNWLKDGVNHAVLHDLRISVDGETAQIDHLVINRALRIYLFETKCFNGHLQINAQGEFTLRYGSGKAFGIVELRRRVVQPEKAVRELCKASSKHGLAERYRAEASRDIEGSLRFRAEGMAANRRRLQLSAADFGLVVGATRQSVCAWGVGRARPGARSLAAIASLRSIGKREAAERLKKPKDE